MSESRAGFFMPAPGVYPTVKAVAAIQSALGRGSRSAAPEQPLLEAGPRVSETVNNEQAYAQLVEGFADFICPSSGTLDLLAAAPVVDPIYDGLLASSFSRERLQVLAAIALLDAAAAVKDVNKLLPEDFNA